MRILFFAYITKRRSMCTYSHWNEKPHRIQVVNQQFTLRTNISVQRTKQNSKCFEAFFFSLHMECVCECVWVCECTYNFWMIFCLGNEFGPIVIIIFRLKSKCVNLGNACNAVKLISRIWLFVSINISSEFKPWKMGMRSNLFSLSFKSTRFGKFWMPCSHISTL